MDNIINLQKKIVPELSELLVLRYQILRQVSHEAPIGRRALAIRLGLSERVLRAQVDFLKNCGLLNFSPLGMFVTDEGEEILKELAEYVRKLQGISSLEKLLTAKLQMKKVVIIPGNCDEDDVVKREIGRAAATILNNLLSDGQKRIIAVSGGTTMAALAMNISGNAPQAIVVPARGGLGDNVEDQANTIAAVLGRKFGAKYKQLYVPDGVSEDVLNSILAEDTTVKSVVEIIRQADVLVHGMGRADEMAKRRDLDENVLQQLELDGAVGEAIGQYCSLEGEVVYVTNNAGLMVNDLFKIKTVIGVGGGRSKSAAILAVIRATRQDILVTDEAAANDIVQILAAENS
ncbi:MAG TPA: DNA-binding transcriptional regulator [Candidatus Avacidaminococcus intestinavium]|uniref:DNA-binding transcriptional regulator n=1 Tax=Candidatus Avacidaminococcus intestinavium TaxID=2840684 RepID=A0A9D1MPY1_9FIRM|nr:DNA-binding transcriptional regulator [Candidatus Avacidaminococcus intestinavium]